MNAQPGGLEIRRAGLGVFTRGLYLAMNASPGVNLVGEVERQHEITQRVPGIRSRLRCVFGGLFAGDRKGRR